MYFAPIVVKVIPIMQGFFSGIGVRESWFVMKDRDFRVNRLAVLGFRK